MNYPSVTQVLAHFGYYNWVEKVRPADAEAARLRGQAVHKACHTLLLELDRQWNDDTERFISPWLNGYRKALRDHRPKYISHEKEYVSQIERVKSHPDQEVFFNDVRSVWEIKTGLFPEPVRDQSAGQVIAMEDRSVRRFCLQLPGNGKYKLIPLSDPNDFSEFTLLVRTWWKLCGDGIISLEDE